MKLLSILGEHLKHGHKEQVYHRTLTQVMLGLAIVILGVFFVVHLLLAEYVMAVIQGCLAILYAIAYFDVFHVKNQRFKEIAVVVGTCLLFWFFLIDGGIANTAIYWIPFFPFMIFAVAGIYRGLWWIALFLCGAVAIEFLDYMDVLHTPYTAEEVIIFFVAFVFYVMVGLVFEILRSVQQKQLEEKNTSLLAVREKLSHTLEHLEQEIQSRTVELKESNQKLAQEVEQHQKTDHSLREAEQKFFQAQKMEALGTLVGGLAHDFSNVMSGISANLFLIQREIKGNSLVQDKLDDVEKLVFHASDMSKQLLTFARKDDVEKKTFDMASFINEALKLGVISLSSRIKVAKDLTKSPLLICGSATQLQQVLLNLLNNAKDALSTIQEPEIRVTLKPLDQATHLREKHPDLEGKWLYLCFCDNGEGISQQNLVHIFEPFFTTKEQGKGTGLGLAMCYGAIKSHGGMIEVESAPKHGTSFHIYLPLELSAQERQKQDVHFQGLVGNGETILIVDDDKALRLAHQSALENLNYKVLLAEDGLEAIKIYAQKKAQIDLVMMDSVMPNMDGVKAAQHILMMDKQAKIFFATAYEKNSTTERRLTQDAKELDSIRRLQKPFTIEQLCQVIREELE
ncbi:hybrid sensor histidine kinase/response regulator [Ghiorsea bivora]|uniref:hybrid sensor histidine kinase/response regulator n=1 Tax=Ghiorsea bivora TaxID=1485545 RepID=UPI00068D549B|nr:ATP-binding protein [Ghiorsea bivora]